MIWRFNRSKEKAKSKITVASSIARQQQLFNEINFLFSLFSLHTLKCSYIDSDIRYSVANNIGVSLLKSIVLFLKFPSILFLFLFQTKVALYIVQHAFEATILNLHFFFILALFLWILEHAHDLYSIAFNVWHRSDSKIW